MGPLDGKRILLGVTGGVAAYKAAELVRRLRDAGAQVRVVMTRAADAFVTPLTFQALSGHAVHRHLLDPESEVAMGHIGLARWADAVVVAPAVAHFIARLAHGMADDLLTTLCLACEAPISLVPSMNRVMWENPATQANIALLQGRGVAVFGPASGPQACGETGAGRMLEPGEVVAELVLRFAAKPLAARCVLVSAGPTREPIDPVRFLGNRSSGKMGFAVASAAAEAGARVILVAGPVSIPTPPRVERVDVESAAEMHAAVLAHIEKSDIYIGVAAVADYRPVVAAGSKIKKTAGQLTLELEPTEDILAEIATRSQRPFTVGFAAETDRLAEYAEKKRGDKSLDMVAANLVGGLQGGFERDENALEVFWEGGRAILPMAPKQAVARQLVALIAERYQAKSRGRKT